MTSDEAIEAVRQLTLGLPHEDTLDATVARLMERIAASPQADVLRDALVEHGARALVMGQAAKARSTQ